jgi:N6-adenosine-specific RNA methylase IME4
MNDRPAMRRIDEILVVDRHRKAMGDIAGLAVSIRDIGLLHPIVVRRDGRLIAGERRLAAAALLGLAEVPINVVDIDSVVRGEFAENQFRKNFTPSELVAIGQEVERIERDQAKTRKAHEGRPGKLPERQTGDARDKIAAQLGVSGRTYEKAKAVVAAAEAEPERYGHLVEELDRYRGVDRAYRALRVTRDERRVLGLKPRVGKYRTLLLDPPWQYDFDFLGRGAPQYALLSPEDILALPVPDWAEADSHLYLCATNANLPFACQCLAHWGFEHKNVISWIKPPPFGLGAYFRNSTELVLFGVRGTLATRPAANAIATHFEAPRGEHSEKPERLYEIIRAASYPPYGEAFQRQARPDFANLYREARREAEEA